METYGILSLLPVTVVIVLVLLTRKTTASLLVGAWWEPHCSTEPTSPSRGWMWFTA